MENMRIPGRFSMLRHIFLAAVPDAQEAQWAQGFWASPGRLLEALSASGASRIKRFEPFSRRFRVVTGPGIGPHLGRVVPHRAFVRVVCGRGISYTS